MSLNSLLKKIKNKKMPDIRHNVYSLLETALTKYKLRFII
jgi:hypothetical protein